MELVFVGLIITATLIKELTSDLSSGDGGGADGRPSRLKDHGKNEEAKQGWKDDRINHGTSWKGLFRSSPTPTQVVCQSRDRYKDCSGRRPSLKGWRPAG